MRKLTHMLLAGTLILACSSCGVETTANYQVIPLPQEVALSQESPFNLNDGTIIAYPEHNELLKRNAEFLAEYISQSTGHTLQTEALAPGSEAPKGAITLGLDPAIGNREGYVLTVKADRVTLNGQTENGVFYGIQTLRKSIPAETKATSILLPAGSIQDEPRFSYRGMHLDVGRHFFPIEFVKKYIDLLALHNMNTFHWHLTEDQGWRIEIKKYPKLTEIGAWRDRTVIGRNTEEYDNTRYGGFYTQEQAKEIVKYAGERYITVIPEVDLPGHMLAALAAYPEMGCTFVVLPFMYYDTYGDDSLIRKYYNGMRRYIDYMTTRANDGIVSFGLGDWYDYGDFRAGFSRNTPVPLVATAHYYMVVRYLVEAARMLDNRYDVAYYTHLGEEINKAFHREFYHKDTRQYGTGSQCSNALPLFLGMVPAEDKQAVLDNLVADIKRHGNRLTTGDVGNRYLFQTLARNGLNELMYTMHNHEEAPGYGFQLKFGATTLTEQWDPRQGSSWNHFMMGQIDEWFFNSLAGIRTVEGKPGMKEIEIRPRPVGDLTYVRASTQTLYGKVAVDWIRENGVFTLKVTIPVGCTARVFLPDEKEPKIVESGTYSFKK